METMMVKNEENVGRQRMRVTNGEAEGTRSVKRRRRDKTVAALSNSDDNKDGNGDDNMAGSNGGGNSKLAERLLW